ncbi:phospholipid hydroperoxide glutathione peroxidase, chloroplastic [Nicotiana tabacum]|uniref:Phospholipid hydroperoxide glutathione peroxidase, chloroplastic n=1 Tax=Nicotiana tabacum TaxID=4097 RepID=A0A1S3X4L0_TOBAC|nr:probable glutathione peroxidase 3, mitochondrial [Nicotiana tomentosiformis]XP_016434761.1 PREDICTED: probable glutathione peroxidase 3, mitochondrial [Nicotiana tabacum]
MASMVFASTPLSAKSFVKLRTNSKYSPSSCFVPSPFRDSYLHLSYKISHVKSSKSSFIQGDGFSNFSLPKFSRVANSVSPSLNTIKAGEKTVYRFEAYDIRENKYISLRKYSGKVLLIVNIPEQGSDETKSEIKLLNELHNRYKDGKPKGFAVLGFLYDNKETGTSVYGGGKQEILNTAEFPLFDKVKLNEKHEHWYGTDENKRDEDLYYFLKKETKGGDITEEFVKILVDWTGVPAKQRYDPFPISDDETKKSEVVKSGENPGATAGPREDPRFVLENAIARLVR